MAKRKKTKPKDCNVDNCLVHKFWPAIRDAFGTDATYHIDQSDGELVIRTGLRVLPDGQVNECPWVYEWARMTCPRCGRSGKVRIDVVGRGLTKQCPYCSAEKQLTELS
jgi:hypothetical protein